GGAACRQLSQEALNRPHGVVARPVHLPDHPEAHAPVAADEEARGQNANSPCSRRLLVWIEENAEPDVHALDELPHSRLGFTVARGEDREGLPRQPLLEPPHRGHLVAARVAPRRPEVDQNDTAEMVGERAWTPGEVVEGEGGRLSFRPRQETRPLRAR